MGEEFRVAIRAERHDALDKIKSEKSKEIGRMKSSLSR